jgi:hypothetical protein
MAGLCASDDTCGVIRSEAKDLEMVTRLGGYEVRSEAPRNLLTPQPRNPPHEILRRLRGFRMMIAKAYFLQDVTFHPVLALMDVTCAVVQSYLLPHPV